MFATLAQTGMRKAEVALPANETFGKRHLSRANLAWRIGGRLLVDPTAAELADLAEGDYALLTVAPSKADQHGLIWSPAPIVLPFHSSEHEHPVCAARELMRLELAATARYVQDRPTQRRRQASTQRGLRGAIGRGSQGSLRAGRARCRGCLRACSLCLRRRVEQPSPEDARFAAVGRA